MRVKRSMVLLYLGLLYRKEKNQMIYLYDKNKERIFAVHKK